MDQDTLKREIKFRAWGRYGDWDEEGENQAWQMIDADALCFEEFKPLCDLLENKEDQEYFMQYTGLKDNNGNEVYEGDVLRDKHERRLFDWEVVFRNGSFGIVNIGIDGYKSDFFPCDSLYFFNDRKVIGNIFQNPELLTP